VCRRVTLVVEFCGERRDLSSIASDVSARFVLGRDADFVIDDNPFLHRHFLALACQSDLWLLSNVGDQLAATVSDGDGRLEAFLGPGGVLPIVFRETIVRFTAGPTSYEVLLELQSPTFNSTPSSLAASPDGATTVGRVSLTPDQRFLILALAESALRSSGRASAILPTSAQAALRLGWTTTKFNRKLDNVCDKLTKLGVRGLHGDTASLASNRRARLVEYALAVRLVTRDELQELERARAVP